MDGPSPEPDFPVSRCAACGREVLTHVRLAADGEERRHCLHCDAEMDPVAVRWVLKAEIQKLGYAFEGEEVVGGCGSGGCGSGSCGRG